MLQAASELVVKVFSLRALAPKSKSPRRRHDKKHRELIVRSQTLRALVSKSESPRRRNDEKHRMRSNYSSGAVSPHPAARHPEETEESNKSSNVVPAV